MMTSFVTLTHAMAVMIMMVAFGYLAGVAVTMTV